MTSFHQRRIPMVIEQEDYLSLNCCVNMTHALKGKAVPLVNGYALGNLCSLWQLHLALCKQTVKDLGRAQTAPVGL